MSSIPLIFLCSSLTLQLLRTCTSSPHGRICLQNGITKFTRLLEIQKSNITTTEQNFGRQISKRRLKDDNKVFLQRYYQDFKSNWCRIYQSKLDWKRYLAPCGKHRKWGIISAGWKDKKSKTSAANSVISKWDIRPAGQFSRFFIQSKTSSNHAKIIGGDSWRIHVSGASSVSATVFDHNNGSYEVLFLLMESGLYHIEIYLDYTLCDGFKDPPVDWFKKGKRSISDF